MLSADVGTAQGDRHDLRSAGRQGIAHDLVGRKFPRAEQEREENSRPAISSGCSFFF